MTLSLSLPWIEIGGLSRAQSSDRRTNRYAARAYDSDPLVGGELLSDRGLRQIGLRLHQACDRIVELFGDPHDRGRIVARAVANVRRGHNRADQNKSRQHRKARPFARMVQRSATFEERASLRTGNRSSQGCPRLDANYQIHGARRSM